METAQSVRRLARGEALALNVGYVTNLFYALLPPTLASFRNAPYRSINLFDMSAVISFVPSLTEKLLWVSFVYTSLLRCEGCNFGRSRPIKP